MNENFKFSYCLLQYRHNPWLKERMNIGVLMFSRSNSFFKLKVRSWDGRIAAAYPNINKAAFSEDLRQISRAIERFEVKKLKTSDLFNHLLVSELSEKQENHAMRLAMSIASGRDSSYTWAEGGTGTCSCLDARLNSIFQRFVAPFDREKSPVSRTDEQVWTEVSRLIAARNIAEKIEADPKINTELGLIKFQAGYQNGSFHAIQSLSFDLSDEEHISAKAGKWSGFAHAVKYQKRKREVVTQFVLGKPSKDNLMRQYGVARDFLRNVVGHDNVIEEVNAVSFVDRIENDLKHH